MKINRWTKEQTIIAFNLYCKIPFRKATSTNPEIMHIAKIIGRSPNSVKMKIGNFGSFDPELKRRGIVGLANASILDKEVWDEFNGNWEKLILESERLIVKFSKQQDIEKQAIIDLNNIPVGKSKKRFVKTRINQNFFRQTILSAYNSTCCVTGLNISELLIASHIIPWSKGKKERMNPRNGLCLSMLHDKAFDSGLITIDNKYKVCVSKNILSIKNSAAKELIIRYQGKRIILPDRFVPDINFLEYHQKNIFQK